jgi:hypothetical protein
MIGRYDGTVGFFSMMVSGARRSSTVPQRAYGIVAGATVGALPFVLVALFHEGERWPAWAALAVNVALAATSFRTPLAWGLGLLAGIVVSAVVLAVLVQTDWRLVPYVLVGFCGYYLSATFVAVAAYWGANILGPGAA